MGFFKDFKEDFSDAVDELIPGGTEEEGASEGAAASSSVPLDTDSSDINVQDELNKLDGLLEQVSKKVDASGRETMPASVKNGTSQKEKISEADITGIPEAAPAVPEKSALDTLPQAETPAKAKPEAETPAPAEAALEPAAEPEAPLPAETEAPFTFEQVEEKTMDSEFTSTADSTKVDSTPAAPSKEISDENAVITAGMTITGDLTSTGSIEVDGLINGNVTCNGKLTITGTVNGNSSSSEFFADAAKIEGEVNSEGTVKVGVGSVIIGNITATSAVIAGAVKGDIDVQGPVVVDTSAVVMGNIKSRSVQINNGAVIQGFCSQEYADVDVESVFA